jgi:hypothetical protein
MRFLVELTRYNKKHRIHCQKLQNFAYVFDALNNLKNKIKWRWLYRDKPPCSVIKSLKVKNKPVKPFNETVPFELDIWLKCIKSCPRFLH